MSSEAWQPPLPVCALLTCRPIHSCPLWMSFNFFHVTNITFLSILVSTYHRQLSMKPLSLLKLLLHRWTYTASFAWQSMNPLTLTSVVIPLNSFWGTLPYYTLISWICLADRLSSLHLASMVHTVCPHKSYHICMEYSIMPGMFGLRSSFKKILKLLLAGQCITYIVSMFSYVILYYILSDGSYGTHNDWRDEDHLIIIIVVIIIIIMITL
jgi:hypothetical protein